MRYLICLIVIFLLWVSRAATGFNLAEARITPEDIVNAKRASYSQKVKDYSPESKQKLKKLEKRVWEVNQKRTNQLEKIMEAQAAILDEYQRQLGGQVPSGVEKARYWITYAHEAVAYQAAKIYVFDLSAENNLNRDAGNTISLLQSELNSTRSEVVYSQKILKEVVSR